jgi:hypothetical protein
MTIYEVLESDNNRLPVTAQGEAPLASFEDKGPNTMAISLWRRGSCLEFLGDECWFCKGESQRCLAICK